MLINSKITKYLGGFLVGAMLLVNGGLVLAKTNSDNSQSSYTPAAYCSRGAMLGQINDSVLSTLVSAGTITHVQDDQLKAKETQLQADLKAEMYKIKAMTAEEQQAHFKDSTPARVNLWTSLLDDDTMTQVQVDAIKAAVKTAYKAKIKEDNQNAQTNRQTALTTTLNNLVQQNVITSNQSAAIVAKLNDLATKLLRV
jgi:hypothetical protein